MGKSSWPWWDLPEPVIPTPSSATSLGSSLCCPKSSGRDAGPVCFRKRRRLGWSLKVSGVDAGVDR